MNHLNVVNAISCNELFGTGPTQFRWIWKLEKFLKRSKWTFSRSNFWVRFPRSIAVKCGQLRSNLDLQKYLNPLLERSSSVKSGIVTRFWFSITDWSKRGLPRWIAVRTVHSMINVWKYYDSINRLWKNSIQKVINRCEKRTTKLTAVTQTPQSWFSQLSHVTVPCSLKLCA